MRRAGSVLIVVAALILLLALSMDTTLETGAGGRVHNIGLMQEQELFVLLGIALFVGGIVLLGIGLARRPGTIGAGPGEVVCPFCAETIKRAAIVCRYCGRNLPEYVKGEAAQGHEDLDFAEWRRRNV